VPASDGVATGVTDLSPQKNGRGRGNWLFASGSELAIHLLVEGAAEAQDAGGNTGMGGAAINGEGAGETIGTCLVNQGKGDRTRVFCTRTLGVGWEGELGDLELAAGLGEELETAGAIELFAVVHEVGGGGVGQGESDRLGP